MQLSINGRPQLDRTRHGAESIMRFANRNLQHTGSRATALIIWKLHIEVHLEIGDVITVDAPAVVARAIQQET